jgi:hypothetical protein
MKTLLISSITSDSLLETLNHWVKNCSKVKGLPSPEKL